MGISEILASTRTELTDDRARFIEIELDMVKLSRDVACLESAKTERRVKI